MLKRLLLLLAVCGTLGGCTATQAIRVRTQFEDEAKSKTEKTVDVLASEANYWRNQYEAVEKETIEVGFKNEIANTKRNPNLQTAVDQAVESTKKYKDDLARHEAAYAGYKNVVDTYQRVGYILAKAHQDASAMAEQEAQLPTEVAKHAVTGGLAAAAKVGAAYATAHPATTPSATPTPAPADPAPVAQKGNK